MLGQTLTIAYNAFIESIRQPIFFVLVMISGLLQLMSTWGAGFSMGRSSTSEVNADNKLLLDIGLGTVFVSGMLLAGFIATAVLSREIKDKTVLTVVSKPIGRPIVVIGKYLGTSSAILIAIITMLLFLFMGIRHGVMSTAADTLDGPVIVFTFAAVALAITIAIWCNFFYGWVFSQTAILVMMPAMVLAWLAVLFMSKKWLFQLPSTDLHPQILLTSIALVLAIMVLTAVAIAASTRLGQVMTITVCAGVFMFGLLSNHLIGRHAFSNQMVGVIKQATPEHREDADFRTPGATWQITLERPPDAAMDPGSSFYYSDSPNGYPMAVRPFDPFEGNIEKSQDLIGPRAKPGVIVTKHDLEQVTIRLAGASDATIPATRPPRSGDYVFESSTQINAIPLSIWSVATNLQFFWLVDAVTQNNPIPPGHLILIAIYSASQIVAYLSLAAVLFQKRDVG